MKNKTMRILILICCLLLTGGCMTKGNVISEANDIVNDYNGGNIDYDQTSVKLANLLSELMIMIVKNIFVIYKN